MGIASQGGEVAHLGQVVFLVQDGLIQVAQAPALGHIELEQLGQLLGSLGGHGIAPGAEGNQQVHIGIKGQIAVHHGADAHGADLGQGDAILFLHVLLHVLIAVHQAMLDHLFAVGPHAVQQLVFPGVGAGSQGLEIGADQHGLDAGRTKLDTKGGFAFKNPFLAHDMSLLDGFVDQICIFYH